MSYSAAAKALISASFASDLFSAPVAVKTPTSKTSVDLHFADVEHLDLMS